MIFNRETKHPSKVGNNTMRNQHDVYGVKGDEREPAPSPSHLVFVSASVEEQ